MTTYDPQDSQKKTVSTHLRSCFSGLGEEVSGYSVHFQFFMPLAASLSKSERNRRLWSGVHLEKPDLDNLVKFYLDVSNEILWQDDRFIFEFSASKVYSDAPRTIITVRGIPMADTHDDVQAILALFSPDEFKEMMDGLRQLHSVLETADAQSPRPGGKVLQEHAAGLISRFADSYGDRIKKVSSKYSGAWRKLLKNTLLESVCPDP